MLHERGPVELTDADREHARFTALFRAHYAELFAFVYRMLRDAEPAEEVVQDVFLRLWERGLPAELTRGYLYAAARNRALNYLARRRVTRRWIDQDVDLQEIPGRASPAEGAQYRELAEAARAVIQRLPERGRQVFVLRRDHGLSVSEIAEALDISIKTVETHLARAAHALRTALAPYLQKSV